MSFTMHDGASEKQALLCVGMLLGYYAGARSDIEAINMEDIVSTTEGLAFNPSGRCNNEKSLRRFEHLRGPDASSPASRC